MPVFAFRRISTIGKKNVTPLSNKWMRFFALARGKNILRSSPMPEPAELRRGEQESGSAESPPQAAPDPYAELRREMVKKQIRARGISDPRVLSAMERVPRHEFVPDVHRARAYEDSPLPIGEGQTISQPYIVAAMTAALHLTGPERVLEVGAGSGYQAAILSLLAAEVYTIERRGGGFAIAPFAPCRFVPRGGRYGGGES